jgi:hypothetical protein
MGSTTTFDDTTCGLLDVDRSTFDVTIESMSTMTPNKKANSNRIKQLDTRYQMLSELAPELIRILASDTADAPHFVKVGGYFC